ncbi:hypothetical protein [Enterobacter hormaechei]|uniref:hypothetical protein n=1 Tax=Enterobacter hormaechei TaxID=158836 RepID=UPI0026EA0F12|nr:hypothetical protein [Enterobacter hormaechei]
MSGTEGVRGYKQISLKKFGKAISHNLKLLALSRDLNQYELQNQIVEDFLYNPQTTEQLIRAKATDQMIRPELADKNHYNVFLRPDVYQLTSAMSERLKVPESEIVYAALVVYADKLELSKPLISADTN